MKAGTPDEDFVGGDDFDIDDRELDATHGLTPQLKPSPTPRYGISGHGKIFVSIPNSLYPDESDDIGLGDLPEPEKSRHIKTILIAVNSHAALVESAKATIKALRHIQKGDREFDDAWVKANAALTLAKEAR